MLRLHHPHFVIQIWQITFFIMISHKKMTNVTSVLFSVANKTEEYLWKRDSDCVENVFCNKTLADYIHCFLVFYIYMSCLRRANMNLSDSASSLHMAALRIGSFICTHSICDDLGQTSFHSPLPHRYCRIKARSPLTSCLKSPAGWSLSMWCLSHDNAVRRRLDRHSKIYATIETLTV